MAENTVKLNVVEIGKGFPLVLLHGFPLNHTIWDPVVPLLQEKARLILPDLRGHGRSPAPEGVYAMSTLAADVAAMLDELKIERVVLAGHSMGGYASLAFAQAYPERLAGLALVSSLPLADTPERRQKRYALAEEVARDGVDNLADSMSTQLTRLGNLVEPVRHLIQTTPPAGVIGSVKGMAERPDLTEFLAGLDLPVVMIVGDSDPFAPIERAQEIAKTLKQGRLVRVPGAGHLPMMEMPGIVADALLKLLSV
jgi:pimeloyl-ACP methyl ester carboxylesterase